MEQLRLRPARPSDQSDLDAIAMAAWETSLRPLGDMVDYDKAARDKQRFLHFVRTQLRRIIVADYEDMVGGWIGFSPVRAYVPYLFVAPEVQGRGIGGALLQRVESLFELAGHHAIALETFAGHQRALRFYERHGYHVMAVKHAAQGRSAALSSVRLEKKLLPYAGPIPDLDQD